MKKIARVFPRRTAATPDDELAFTTSPPLLALPEIDEVHVSVAFTYDIPRAATLEVEWRAAGVPVKMGGPAYSEPGEDFVPGRYLKRGYVITSRGCPNRCWFCSVPEREGYRLRELPITEGYNVLDDNLLACSEAHIRAVFAMLGRQRERPIFTGGLEGRLLRPWHVDLLRDVKARRVYFAYDTEDDYEPLVAAGRMLRDGGITRASHKAACYVLIGYPRDSIGAAQARLDRTIKAGFMPYAMLYRDGKHEPDATWKRFQREYLRPEIVASKMAEVMP